MLKRRVSLHYIQAIVETLNYICKNYQPHIIYIPNINFIYRYEHFIYEGARFRLYESSAMIDKIFIEYDFDISCSINILTNNERTIKNIIE